MSRLQLVYRVEDNFAQVHCKFTEARESSPYHACWKMLANISEWGCLVTHVSQKACYFSALRSRFHGEKKNILHGSTVFLFYVVF